MKNGSVAKIMAFLLLITCTATFAGASMFELEMVPLSKLTEQPSVYDSTLAYRKISVVGNLSELNKHSASIADDKSALKVDVTRVQLFEGFELGEQVMLTGEFRHNSLSDDIMYPSYVLHYPVQNAGQANISDINGNPASYNGRYVTITGNMSSIELSAGSYKAMITEEGTGEQMKVFYYGATDLKGGEDVKVYGLYNGGVLHSENMAKNRSPLSLTALVPGFSVVMSLAVLGGVAILLSQRQR